VFYKDNLLFINEAEAGISREAAVKALRAEGVAVTAFNWTMLHTYPFFQEAKWWHHAPAAPGPLPGSEEANRKTISLRVLTEDAPELADQYVKAFEKVWAHREQLARA
jgi:perosamine synthetase